jgi:hypothetical protein
MAVTVKLPQGGTCLSLEGVVYEADAKGCVALPDDADVSRLAAHGCTVPPDNGNDAASPEQPASPDEARRATLFALAVDLGLKPHPRLGLAKLEALVANAEERAAEGAGLAFE